MVSGLAIQLQAIADQGLVQGEPPAAEDAPPAEEPPVSETSDESADEEEQSQDGD